MLIFATSIVFLNKLRQDLLGGVMSKDGAVRELIRLVNSNRNGSVYDQCFTEAQKRGILNKALQIAVEDEREQEEPLVRSGKEEPCDWGVMGPHPDDPHERQS